MFCLSDDLVISPDLAIMPRKSDFTIECICVLCDCINNDLIMFTSQSRSGASVGLGTRQFSCPQSTRPAF